MKRLWLPVALILLALLCGTALLARPLFNELQLLRAPKAEILSTPAVDCVSEQVDESGNIRYLSDRGDFVMLDSAGAELKRSKVGTGAYILLDDPDGQHFIAFLDEEFKVLDQAGAVLALLEREFAGHSGLLRTINGKLWAMNSDQELLQLDHKGQLEWKLQTGGRHLSRVLLRGERRVFESGDGNIYCIDARGKILWSATASLSRQDNSDGSGLLLTESGRSTLICRDVEGLELWRWETEEDVSATMDSAGFTAVADSRGVGKLNPQGQQLWRYSLSRKKLLIYGIGADGCIYAMAELSDPESPGFFDRLLKQTPANTGTYDQERLLLAFSSEGRLLWKHTYTASIGEGSISPMPGGRVLMSEGSKLHIIGLAE